MIVYRGSLINLVPRAFHRREPWDKGPTLGGEKPWERGCGIAWHQSERESETLA